MVILKLIGNYTYEELTLCTMSYLEVVTVFEVEIMLTLGVVARIQLMKEMQVTHSQIPGFKAEPKQPVRL